jgi:hypothetical protein
VLGGDLDRAQPLDQLACIGRPIFGILGKARQDHGFYGCNQGSYTPGVVTSASSVSSAGLKQFIQTSSNRGWATRAP